MATLRKSGKNFLIDLGGESMFFDYIYFNNNPRLGIKSIWCNPDNLDSYEAAYGEEITRLVEISFKLDERNGVSADTYELCLSPWAAVVLIIGGYFSGKDVLAMRDDEDTIVFTADWGGIRRHVRILFEFDNDVYTRPRPKPMTNK